MYIATKYRLIQCFGGIVDDATGSNNTILLSTTGGTGSTTGALSFSLVLEIVKAN